jgi:hypothetical protein
MKKEDFTSGFWNRTEKKFWDKARADTRDGCWNWTAYKDKDGYGIITLHGKSYRAPRFAYMLENGEVDDSLQVLHTCDNPSCVNPRHLRLGTNADNVRDRESKGRGVLSWLR